MFEYIRNHPKVIQLFLALITLPFAFVGIQSYIRGSGAGDDIASVGGSKISQQDFQTALRQQEQQLRASLGPAFRPDMLQRPELRMAVLDSVVNQRLLSLYAANSHLTISDAQLGQLIQSIPEFQEGGRFSRPRYDAYVASQNMSAPEFEARLRQDFDLQQILGAVQQGTIVSRSAGDRWIAALQEQREVSEVGFKPEQFASQVKLGAGAVKTYYDANRKAFEMPAQVRAEYLVLSRDALAAQVNVSEDDIKNWYQAHAGSYKQNEERRASHILISVAKDAPAAAVKAAQAKAEGILAQLKKDPAEFAKLAKQYSQDPGSADKGGDLGWFSRGMMVKAFDDAAFSLKENEISPLVRSDFGFHIIKLTGIRAAKMKPLADVRADIIDTLKRQAAMKKYDEIAESFSNTVYEQADSLKPAADKFKLTIQQSPWIAQGGQVAAPLNDPKLLAALFSDDAIKNKHNTEAIEVAPNTLVSARVLEFKPAALQPLEAARGDIEKRLIHDEASKLADQAGQAALAKLKQGGSADLSWAPEKSVTRLGMPGLSPEALHAIFRADVGHLPAYVGVPSADGGYSCYRISQVKPFVAAATDDARSKTLRQQYQQVIAGEEFSAWLAALRLRYPVDINKAALATKEQ